MKTRATLVWVFALVCLCFSATMARAAEPTLDIYWIDVEGGGATLIITPAHESILIDAGWATGPSAARIHDAATRAGVSRIDYLILTHFHPDHFGGAAPLSALMPIGTVLDRGIPEHDPEGQNDERFFASIKSYREFPAERRKVIQLGETLPLKDGSSEVPSGDTIIVKENGSFKQLAVPPGKLGQSRIVGSATLLSFRFMGVGQHFIHPPGLGGPNSLCASATRQAPDTSDNANSVVSLLQFGSFKFFDGGDLTWNMEGEMVCPTNSIGQVDIYQTDHHGANNSNNPLLIRSLAPAVTVMNNGPRKGGGKSTLATLRSVSSIQTMFQIHRDLRGGADYNTDDEYIANLEEKCAGNYIKCSVDSSGKSYTISIPAKGFGKTYQTHTTEAGP